ncbi:MAG: CDP-diacylglycerol--serine O-phosphatidyltransferase [Deltaproteobacteria bacterium]|nr:CDP-diacylglycerol--serine O-phosphatidyltransferase [Deltaproteobacteria bacterium]
MSASWQEPDGGHGPLRRRRRRRRRRGERRRGLYLLPQLFTTGNLFFGFFSMIQSTQGHFDRAALGIVLAGLCDALDGRVARLARSTSRFGSEYDSLADVVSFGVAPAFLAYMAGELSALQRTGWILAFLFTACAALRLARFNVQASRYAGRFEGLPSPAAAGMVASTQWFASFLLEQGHDLLVPPLVVGSLLAGLGLLMVSAVPYRSFKEIDLRHGFRTVVLVIVALAVILQEPSFWFFALGAAYVASGPLEWAWRVLSGRRLVAAPAPAPSEPIQETRA